MYDSENYLALSGIQHFQFCRRQWALIHIENQWNDNLRTVEGSLLHARAHDAGARERRGNTLILRNLSVSSHALGLSGQCDVVEFHLDDNGIEIHGEEGRWKPYPVEYKRGKPKEGNEDLVQLCAQAIALEEMLCCQIPSGALYYGEPRRRTPVEFDQELRNLTMELSREMHEMFRRGVTPNVKPGKFCNACSLKELCLPRMARRKAVSVYLRNHLQEEDDT